MSTDAQPSYPPTDTALTWRDGSFYLNGREHRILGGAMHYFRIHPGQWEDRIRRLAALGVNTIDTYLPWNFHQPVADRPADFSGWRDVVRFLELAQQHGLAAIVRPGPYICAEWDNGGLPVWLTAKTGIHLRCMDPIYVAAMRSWCMDVMGQLAPLQASAGGPIIAFQIENEYGSYGNDKTYLQANAQALLDAGATELLFTADGGSAYFLDGGELPGYLSAPTFGSGAPAVIELWNQRRPGEPVLNIEYWDGWFDHWGEKHHVRSAESAVSGMLPTLEAGGSVSLYMAHGGTNFGLSAGANAKVADIGRSQIQPTITSYDYDAPIAEDGSLTEKFYAMRDVFQRWNPDLPGVPQDLVPTPETLPTAHVGLTRTMGVLDWLRTQPMVSSSTPQSFDALGIWQGLVLYSTRAVLSAGEFILAIPQLHDRAQVFVDGALVGELDELSGPLGLVIRGSGEEALLEILVESEGRINYGYRLGEAKGILGPVLFGVRSLFGWEQRGVDIDRLESEELLRAGGSVSRQEEHGVVRSAGPGGEGAPGWAHGVFQVERAANTWIALPDFGRGYLWVNDFLLGRYNSLGPQRTLYVPAPVVRVGANTVQVLELVSQGGEAHLVEKPDYGPVDPADLTS